MILEWMVSFISLRIKKTFLMLVIMFYGLVLRYHYDRRWIACLLLVAFFVRALVPSGFMTEFSPLENKFKVVICSASGMKLVDADQDGLPLTDGPKKKNSYELCAIGSLVSLILLKYAEVIPPNPSKKPTIDLGTFSIVPPARASSAHASRAPPVPY